MKKSIGLGKLKRRNPLAGPPRLVEIVESSDHLPLGIRATQDGVDLNAWLQTNAATVEQKLVHHGAILFRGFGIHNAQRLEQIVRTVAGEPLSYDDQATPRDHVSGGVYGTTVFPAAYAIELHNESCYGANFPQKAFFCCEIPASVGGETPVADSRAIYRRISLQTRALFERHGIMYVRNFGEGFGIPWQQVYGVETRAEVEAFCDAHDIQYQWLDDNHLRTRQVRPASVDHPVTGETVWFNQATAFHISTLAPEVALPLLDEYGPMGVPKNALLGDGNPIPEDALDEIRAAVAAETRSFPWQRGDLVLADNLLVAHGRNPFQGERRVLVGFGQALSWKELTAAVVA